MKKFVIAATSILLPFLAQAQSQERVDPLEQASRAPHAAAPLQVLGTSLLLDQRSSLVNSPGTGSGGADESLLQDSTLSMNTFGFAHSTAGSFRVADDFTVPAGGWLIDSITTYAYQTGSTTTSTMNALNFQIWDGPPGDPGSAVVFGDTTTNRLTTTAFSNIYRGQTSAPGATNRPIMSLEAAGLNLTLPAGTYWLDWAAGGTLGSGPWAPPVTITGQTATGNALQFDGATWAAVTDVGQQGFPLTIAGGVALQPQQPVPMNSMWLLMAIAGGIVLVAYRSSQRVG